MGKTLIVETPGLTIKVKGIPEFRTPAKVDISKIDEDLLIRQLHECGIDNYKIKNND